MNTNQNNLNPKPSGSGQRKNTIRQFMERAKKLQGDPHYVAMGMAIGVFVSITPTIPFHTVIAVVLAFVLRGSKPAAVIGVWFSNPVTIPVFYLASYKAGMFLLGKSVPFDAKYESISELLKLGLDVTAAMIAGGAVLGILPGVAAYFITRKIIAKIRSRKMHEISQDTPCSS
ncbi:MAG: DUF2062 domain-containing protein [Pseudomonadota bacterium]|uniref:DUF2062 domain-containing protein n=1 Tax=Candidatus Desulfatibia profunda TaxID=2841695 RepID=A0A8J6NYA5_9BACT|nr:DUF2062 domain-containing protein [Candidatus Desulfatibia profunda]MBL7180055.1 DUF2062 domain-containing protein [Desulfobacterales bacterium]